MVDNKDARKVDEICVSDTMDVIRGNLQLPEKVYFFDTTLRDGEQTPGITFRLDEKIAIAQALSEMGVDIIEAGFPISSQGDFESCKAIAKLGLKSETIGLARLNQKDIDRVIDAGMDAIHVFIATSDLHMKDKLNMTRDQVLNKITEMVSYAKKHFTKIEFSAEDATRSEIDFMIKANKLAVECGATRVNIPDTVGTVTPQAFGYIVRKNYEALPKNVRIAVHCHNDFGLAVANSIAGVENGASQVHTTIMGLGERSGNASFEETAMSLYALYRVPMNINTRRIFPTAKLVESFCGGKVRIGRLKPLIGQNAFAHESGIHAHAMIKNARAYEPITPDLIGIKRGDSVEDVIRDSIKVGKHSGGHALKAKITELGVQPTDDQFNKIVERVKLFGDKGHEVMEADFLAIVKDVMGQIPQEEQYVTLESFTVLTGSVIPTATVKLRIKNNGGYVDKIASSTGVGPVDACVKAIVSCFGEMSKVRLSEYSIDAITGGTEALGHVSIELLDNESGFSVKSSATHEDIVMSSVLALLKGLNMIIKQKSQKTK